MKDIEGWLKEQTPPGPSRELDARIDRLFQQHSRARHMVSWPVPLWLSAAACLLCFAGGMLASMNMQPPSVPSQSTVNEAARSKPQPVAAKENLFDWSAPGAAAPAAWERGATLVMEIHPGPERPVRGAPENIIVEQLES